MGKRCSLKKLGIVTLSATILAGGILPSVSHAQEAQYNSETHTVNAVSYYGNLGEFALEVISDDEIGTIHLTDEEAKEIQEVIAEQQANPQIAPRSVALGAYITSISVAGIGTIAIYAGGIIVAGVVAYAGYKLYKKVESYITPYVVGAKIPKSLRKDGKTVNLGKFKDKFGKTPVGKTSGTYKNGDWVIEKDTAQHGGRKWKIKRGKTRVGSLDGNGKILAK